MVQVTATAMKAKQPGRHKYIAIRDWLTEQIADGTFARGEQIPSEHNLMARFKVSRVTARQALSELKKSGFIEAKHGKGYFVSNFTATSNLTRLQSFGEMMEPLGVETSSDIIELCEVRPDKETAEALNVSENALVVRLIRSRNAGGRNIALSISSFPLALGRKIMCLNLAHQDLYHLMEDRLKIELAYADATLDSVPLQAKFGKFIGVKEQAPVIRIKRVTFDTAGVPLVHETTFCALESIKFQVRIPRW